MSDAALIQLSLAAARIAIARGELCPVNYVDALLAHIEARDPQIHSFITVTAERARTRARHLRDMRPRAVGHARPVASGIPLVGRRYG